MKTLSTSAIILSIFMSISSYAQTSSEKFQSAIKKGLEQMATSKTSDEFLKNANYFERVGQVESKEWLAPYYAAYNNLIAGIMIKDDDSKDLFFDKAEKEIDQANLLSSNNSEIYALTGYIQFMKMSVDPKTRYGMISQADASLAKAKEINPENPRFYLISGQNAFYTPEAFGGGKNIAKPILETAVAKFTTFKSANSIEPNWGSDRAKTLLAECN
jgi:hypothetical protein